MVLIERPAANTKFVRVESRKVEFAATRYRPGQRPAWEDEESDEDEDLSVLNRTAQRVRVRERKDNRTKRLEAAGAELEQEKSQGRRRRVVREAELEENEDTTSSRPAPRPAPRRRDEDNEAEVAMKEQGERQQQTTAQNPTTHDPLSEHDEFLRRRELGRQRRFAATNTDEQVLDKLVPRPTHTSGHQSDESEYEEVTETESDEGETTALAKPTFIAKNARITSLEQKQYEHEQDQLQKRRVQLLEKRRQDTKQMVIDDQKRSAALADTNDEAESDRDMPNDDDNVDEAEMHELWKLRELKRMKRYKAERRAQEAEKLEIERRRNLTDDQRKQENIDYEKRLKAMGLDKSKVKWNFMQKYYHKGAYHQDEAEKGLLKEDIYNRDVGHAVGADSFNKELLPKAMRVRGNEFGKRGQSKWTHLVNEDTTYQKDASGNMMENSFVTTTFATAKSTESTNKAFQLAENTQMFRHAKVTDVTPVAPGSVNFGAVGKQHKDRVLDRPSAKRVAR